MDGRDSQCHVQETTRLVLARSNLLVADAGDYSPIIHLQCAHSEILICFLRSIPDPIFPFSYCASQVVVAGRRRCFWHLVHLSSLFIALSLLIPRPCVSPLPKAPSPFYAPHATRARILRLSAASPPIERGSLYSRHQRR